MIKRGYEIDSAHQLDLTSYVDELKMNDSGMLKGDYKEEWKLGKLESIIQFISHIFPTVVVFYISEL